MKLAVKEINNKLKPYEPHLVILISLIFALIARFRGIHAISYDMGFVLKGWYEYLIKNGGFSALKDGFYNYNPPYMYLMLIATYIFKNLPYYIAIKLISIPFDFMAAFLAYKIVDLRYPKSRKSLFAFMAVLYCPTVVVNSAYWGQCDIIYTTFLLICLYLLLLKKELLAFINFGIAFSFKLQALFFGPVLFILFLKRSVKWYSFLIIPLVAYLALLPAHFAGRSMRELRLIYIGQMNSDEYLTVLSPTFYQWISNDYFELFSKLGLVLAATVILLWSFILYKIKFKVTQEIIIQIALISLIMMPFFLPKMHERYFFSADVLSIIYAFYYPKFFWVPFIMIFSSLICYYPANTGIILFPISYLSFTLLLLIMILLVHLFVTIYQQKQEKLKVDNLNLNL